MNNPIIANIVLFGSFLGLMMTGFPIAFCLLGIGLIGILAYMGWDRGVILTHLSVIDTTNFWMLFTIPIYIFMASLMAKTRMTDDIYNSLRKWTQDLPGGLAIATILLGIIYGSLSGESSASVVTEGIICIPSMEKYKYDRKLTLGCILAAASLDILIPPSLIMIVYVVTAEASIGRMWIAGYPVGVLLGVLFIAYIIITCMRNPALAPAIPLAERVDFKEKLISLKYLAFPMLVTFSILASMFFGILAPSEAGTIGCFAVFCYGFVMRRLSWRDIVDSAYVTIRMTCMIMWIFIAAKVFKTLYFLTGAGQTGNYIVSLGLSEWTGIILMQLILLVMGFFLDPFVIIVLIAPIVRPMILQYGLDPVWFGILFVINMSIGLLTPPIGLNIFYMKEIAPKGTQMQDLYKAALPFAILGVVGLALVMIFPGIALWLPSLMFGGGPAPYK
jgi:tripartite ATP-independent transporter DctM subunit